MPWMWIVAGPNGAGKSTFTNMLLADIHDPDIIKLNADEVTASLRASDPVTPQNQLNLQAARMVDARVEECISLRQDFLVETVLSSNKYRDDLKRARRLGYKTGLLYVSLHPPELSPERVSQRVQQGGHAVEHDTAIKRYHKSHQQLSWFAARVDALAVWDNSSPDRKPILLMMYSKKTKTSLNELRHGRIPNILFPDENPAVWEALERTSKMLFRHQLRQLAERDAE